MPLTKEQIKAASEVSLVAYCKVNGIPLTQLNNGVFRHEGYALRIKDNHWACEPDETEANAGGMRQGTGIQYLQKYEGLSQDTAVVKLLALTDMAVKAEPSLIEMLDGFAAEIAEQKKQKNVEEQDIGPHEHEWTHEQERGGDDAAEHVPPAKQGRPKKKGVFHLPDRSSDNKRIIAYLTEERGIHPSVVNHLIKQNILYEDARNSCVFVGFDKSANAKYAMVYDTSDTPRGPSRYELVSASKTIHSWCYAPDVDGDGNVVGKWNNEDFYMASSDCKCDLFYCEETGKIYLPSTNELLEYHATDDEMLQAESIYVHFRTSKSLEER